jgi:hypothetical protein
MMTIWKYSLTLLDEQQIQIPEGAKILSVQIQNDEICIWALVDTERPKETRSIGIIGTGNPCWCPNWNYIGTVQQDAFVWHIFIN